MHSFKNILELTHTFLDIVNLTIDINGHFLGYFNSVPDGITVCELASEFGNNVPQISHHH